MRERERDDDLWYGCIHYTGSVQTMTVVMVEHTHTHTQREWIKVYTLVKELTVKSCVFGRYICLL